MVELAEYVVREFSPEDLEQVINVNMRCLPEHYPRFFYLEIAQRFPKAFLVAADSENKIVGYVMARVERSIVSFLLGEAERKGHIISIAVLPEHRGRGLGKMLMSGVMSALRDVYRCSSCYLEVRVSNEIAINLYRRIGFRIIRKIRGYYRDGEDAYVMEAKLG